MRILGGLLGLCFGALPAQSLEVVPTWTRGSGTVALQQAARDAATDQLVMVLASHPDDRYVMPAAYLRFARGWRVAIVLATRGEGGQNSEGPETGDELGWRRTLETEACAAALDAQVWYLNRRDAGFCRSAQEALELWGRDETVRRLARAIRVMRPDVVLTTHHPEEPHGHDLALLEILPAALALAADPQAAVPELDGLRPMRVSRAFRGAAGDEVPRAHDCLNMEEMDRARGDTYRRLAYAALKLHRSAEPIRDIDDLFDPVVPLYLVWGDAATNGATRPLFHGLPSLFDASLLAAHPALQGLDGELRGLSAWLDDPDRLLRSAIALRTRLASAPLPVGSDADVRRQRRIAALDRVVLLASSFRVTAAVGAGAVATACHSFPIAVRVHHTKDGLFRDLRFTAGDGGKVTLPESAQPLLARVPGGAPFAVHIDYLAAPGAADRQQWLRGLFHAETFEPPVSFEGKLTVLDPESAERAFDIAFPIVVASDLHAPVEFEVVPNAVVLPRDADLQTIAVRIGRHADARVQTRLEVLGPPGFEVDGSPVDVQMGALEHHDFQFIVRVPERLRPGTYNLHVRFGEHHTIIPVHKIDVRVPDHLAVALVPGVDDAARSLLRAFLGNRLEVLEGEEITLADLDRFDTVVIDIRALRERPGDETWKAARAAFPRLLRFVRRGGRLVVFYHKDTEFNAEAAGFEGWPFPLRLGQGRVTREDAPIEILDPEHPILHSPNLIKPEDWDGWVQERGLYFPAEYAPEYQEILATADPGQPAMRGALLYTRYGEGDYIYCALSLFRQLKILHPGACRIFANLISPLR